MSKENVTKVLFAVTSFCVKKILTSQAHTIDTVLGISKKTLKREPHTKITSDNYISGKHDEILIKSFEETKNSCEIIRPRSIRMTDAD